MTAKISPRLIALLLLIAALLPRLPGLARFLTSDENTNIFFAGSDVIAAFLRGDLRGTYWHFYPGVTMSWLDALGMVGQYALQSLAGKALPPFTDYIYGDILSLVVANRLPYALLTALAVPALYLLARQLLPNRVALLGALFLAFDPFYLAHSRVAHGDAPVAVFMSLSALTFFIYVRRTRESALRTTHYSSLVTFFTSTVSTLTRHRAFTYLALSAILGSLAALTKAPGQFMALFVVGLSLLYAVLESISQRRGLQQEARSETGPSRGGAVGDRPQQEIGDRPQQEARSETGHSRGDRPQQEVRSETGHSRGGVVGDRPQPEKSYALRTTQCGLTPWLLVITAWGLISLVTFIILWPSMWVDPIGTMRQMLDETFGKVNEGHLVYFFGQPTLDPGPWFYAYVIPFRMTPVILIGSVLSLLFLIPKLNSFTTPYAIRTTHYGSKSASLPHLSPLFLLWLFTLTLFLFGELSPKKQDRYLLPLFPFLDLLAAVGWLGMINLTINNYQLSINNYQLTINKFKLLITNYYLPITLFLLHALPSLTYYPYYLAYFNPLMGGPTRAAETTLMGWGEGMEQVAAYLNQKPNAAQLYVASTPSQTLLPYFAGTGENFYTNDIAFRADYVVLYLAQRQRLAPSPEIVGYFESREPEAIIDIQGVPYAKIYPGPKLILPDIPPEVIPINLGLADQIRLAGYTINNPQGKREKLEINKYELTLYWYALAPLSTDYTVSVRARAADGALLAQQDSWPVEGLLATSQWRQGDYVVDRHALKISPEAWSRLDHFEVVVYEAQSGTTLGSPLSLPLVEAVQP